MKTVVYVGASLDGYIAEKGGSLDWLQEIPNPEGSDFGFNEFLANIDAIVMGKNTFETVVTFKEWPYTKPVFVLSHTLRAIPDSLEKKAKIITGVPKEILTRLRGLGYQNLYIDGGVTIQSFLREDLINELIISTIPVLLGDGIPLFGKLSRELKFDLIKSTVYNETIVKNHYRRKAELVEPGRDKKK